MGQVSSRSRFLEDIGRSLQLFQGFRTQYDDPDAFYTMLADDTVSLLTHYTPLAGRRVVDVGGGRGYFGEAFRRAGADSVFVEPFWEELGDQGRRLGYGVVADGLRLPFPDATFDVSHSSNVLEHVTGPQRFLDEMLRVIRPAGTMFLAFTNWFSPFGGHETSPWHYLGGEHAAVRYERKTGHAPKNRFGSSLFRLDISEVLALVENRPDANLVDAFPRYYPRWTRPLVALPFIREVATWNLVVVLRRR
jgi:SAM-dependent methyltransferase